MKPILRIAVFATVAVTSAVMAHDTKKGDAVTLTGEVMDLTCYMQHPESGQGPEHTACARQCINKGLPAGLKVGEELYLLIGKGHTSVTEVIAEVAGINAKVTGTLITQDGVRAIVVTEAVAADE